MKTHVHAGIAENLQSRRAAGGISGKTNITAIARTAVRCQCSVAGAGGLVERQEAAECAADRAGIHRESGVACGCALLENYCASISLISSTAIHGEAAATCARVLEKNNLTGTCEADERAIVNETAIAGAGRAMKE